MDDRELLELAAKAAGYDVRWHEYWYCFVHIDPVNTDNPPTLAGKRDVWVPLDDDGDALRLAAALFIDMEFTKTAAGARGFRYVEPYADHGGDRLKAVRRAIVRAAAAIGQQAGKP